jgi:hypothetical protein
VPSRSFEVLTSKRRLELAGIEPASPHCERGALPLCDSPMGYLKKASISEIFQKSKAFLIPPQKLHFPRQAI